MKIVKKEINIEKEFCDLGIESLDFSLGQMSL